MNAIWIEITATRGSTPRDTGTAMKVTPEATEGTIGGGALEHNAISHARKLLCEDGEDIKRIYPLGPNLGQCCGGAVTLRFTRDPRPTDRASPVTHRPSTGRHPRALWLWGAGHVGRAVVRTLPPDAFKITWIDATPDRFPANVPDRIQIIPTTNMPALAARAPNNAHHLIFTYSHDIDFALCATLLKRQTASIGLIGSATKRARFFKRLRALGLDPVPIICPIGNTALGKSPDAIAKGVAAELMQAQMAE